jgi:hypothetical protein
LTWLDKITHKGWRVETEPLQWLALEFICFNMRPIDREEVFDNLPTDNPLEIAAMLFQAVGKQGCAWQAKLNGRPAACLGVFENFPGNWQIFSFGTEDYQKVVTGFLPSYRAAESYALDRGMHRLECRSLSSHKEAHGFLRAMGFDVEAVLRGYGRNRQDYVLFRRLWGFDETAPDRGDADLGPGARRLRQR